MIRKNLEINSEKNTTIDGDGVILDQTETRTLRFSFKDKEPKYVKFYLKGIGKLYGITNNENKILMASLNKIEYGTNRIFINKFIREEIASIADTKETVVKNTFNKFVKMGIMIRLATGIYQFNPYIFGSGTWKDIKGLRLTIEYTDEGENIKTVQEIKE